MAGRLPLQDQDICDLGAAWRDWADATDPHLSPVLFREAAERGGPKLVNWLDRPEASPFTVVAETAEEGLAALARAFEDHDGLRSTGAGERVVVARTPQAVTKIAAAASEVILVVATPEVEAAAGSWDGRVIVVTHRNAVEGEPDLVVDLVSDRTLHEGLTAMNLPYARYLELQQDSGGSLVVLRRRLARLPALRNPPWANDRALGVSLIPLMMVGAWDSASEADRVILEAAAAMGMDEIERTVAGLVGGADSPVWSIGTMRGVVSKIDAFHAIQGLVTQADLTRFFQVAEIVLAEADPALELPEEKRWAANVYGKTRQHSGVLRQGLCETAVLLSVHGDRLFRSRLGVNVKGLVDGLVRRLLTPLAGATWLSQRQDLPRYAEAAPEVFLGLLEDDLRSADPKVLSLMTPAESSMFSSPGRTHLLWALETLAWNPLWMPRVVAILGRLAMAQPADNWANTAEGSLGSILRSWLPQTAAPLDDRLAALDMLLQQFPSIGWRLSLAQFDHHATTGEYAARPRWRDDARGAGEGVPHAEAVAMAQKGLELAIAHPGHNETTLGDLIDRLEGIPPADRPKVWAAVSAWLHTDPSDRAKALLRERIRRAAIPARRRARGLDPALPAQSAKLYAALEPEDPVWRHHWLFAQQYVPESASELIDDGDDFLKRDEQIAQQRDAAMAEVWAAGGVDAIRRLAEDSEAPMMIGWHLARVLTEGEVARCLEEVLGGPESAPLDACLSGLLAGLAADHRARILTGALAAGGADCNLSTAMRDRLLLRAPFAPETWDIVDQLPEAARETYWTEVLPRHLFDDPPALNRAVEELLRRRRPRAAFSTARLGFKQLETARFLRLLHDAGTVGDEPAAHYRLSSYDVSSAFEHLTGRPDVDPDSLARLEFLFIDALTHSKHGIRNLERNLASSPSLFVQALVYAFRRRGEGEDPPELAPKSPESAEGLARASYTLLTRARRLPGLNDKGEIDGRRLRLWIAEVRTLAREFGRSEVAESCMGQVLAHSPPGTDGIWPAEAVRDVLEERGSPELTNGMKVGRFNGEGAVWRGAGGGQERGIAEEYRQWARQTAGRHPFTARMLMEMAEDYEARAAWHDDRTNISKRLAP
jgi:hypothetical protein